MILNILIATINNRIGGLQKIILNHPNVIYTVSHQVTEVLQEDIEAYIVSLQNNPQVIYTQITSSGVAKNRNNALQHRVKGSICLLCDDDVIYFDDAFTQIRESFEQDKCLEFLTFKIKTFQGDDYKPYKKESYIHTLRTLTSIGIVDVAFKEDVLERYNLYFDERFGPGGYYPIGEDFIFMTDAYKKGAHIVYKPLDVVQHDVCGTGGVLQDRVIFGRGAVFARVFGLRAFVINLYFAYKHKKRYSAVYSIFQYTKLLMQGSRDFLHKDRR